MQEHYFVFSDIFQVMSRQHKCAAKIRGQNSKICHFIMENDAQKEEMNGAYANMSIMEENKLDEICTKSSQNMNSWCFCFPTTKYDRKEM